jgi:acyl-coenzyme A thioesterase PaaI-like protein
VPLVGSRAVRQRLIRAGKDGIFGIVAMPVKIGKNTSRWRLNCRNIEVYSQTMSLVVRGGPRRRVKHFPVSGNEGLGAETFALLARKFAGAEV